MTEDEAKTKWCPAARFHGTPSDDSISNRQGFEWAQPDRCIASACMSWRWSEEKRTAAYVQAVIEHMKATGDNYSKAVQAIVLRRDEFKHTEGFCGLAGAL